MTYFRGSSIYDLLGILFLDLGNKEPDLLDTALKRRLAQRIEKMPI
jgi:hypothetical protein